jgi:tight adherence protein C
MTGALLGLLGGAGLWLAIVRMPVLRRPTLDQRLAPYLRETPRPSRLLARTHTHTPLPSLERIARPYLADAVGLLERVLGGGASVRRRLAQAGRRTTLEEFRAEQVLWGATAMLGAIVISVVMLARGQVRTPILLLVFCLGAAVAGVLARDRWLGHEIQLRERAMVAEFPTIAELLALAVGAGEGAVGALERVARICTGELSREVGLALADARAGASLVTALTGIAERTTLPALVRFVDGVAVAVERGTPLADVLRAQAGDVRELGRRALMETGGRKEIAMMIPVVFLVLPVTVVFALYPGLANLSLTF